MRRRLLRALVVIVVVAVVGLALWALRLRERLRCASFAGPGVSSSELPPPPDRRHLRLAAWNIRNFPRDERPARPDLGWVNRTNLCDLSDALAGLDADVLGVAEITDPPGFPPLLREATGRSYRVALTSRGRHRLGVAWDDARLELVGRPVEVRELERAGGRPALAVRLRGRVAGGPDLTVVQVHLKAGPEGFPTRLGQYRALARWLNRWVEEVGDNDVVVQGDMNTTGPRGGTTAEELAVADRILAEADLRRLANATGCSAYWPGEDQGDGRLEPSLIDQVYVRGLEELDPSTPLEAWLHCRRSGCAPLVSRPGAEDGTFWDVSDHCPLTYELVARDLD